MPQQAYKRLVKEYKQIRENPPPYIIARPSESNILDWHYVITGPPGTPYEGGQYHGRVTFPSEYPFKPPRIKMCTPSGRFEINQRICLSMSDFHEELWNPSWSVATIINGLLSFMTSDERTTGSIVTPESTKRELARRSKYFNLHSNLPFQKNFPELCEQNKLDIEEAELRKQKRLMEGPADEEKVAEEVTTSIDKIQDPEDKIRAKQIQEATLKNNLKKQKKSQNGLLKLSVVLLAIFVGLVLRFNTLA
ncbi:DEKNAAC104477 [Brettanomyces naardenensis]|uniref:Ubiquitin-conjugating enzyme E2 6 n=1 Tax=Brettanomyces naardenensis TaxID=13370 RepID=A0A448YR48_BRENA|nr:DEKNAAC104477 [Brettanomyces naardenensis]